MIVFLNIMHEEIFYLNYIHTDGKLSLNIGITLGITI